MGCTHLLQLGPPDCASPQLSPRQQASTNTVNEYSIGIQIRQKERKIFEYFVVVRLFMGSKFADHKIPLHAVPAAVVELMFLCLFYPSIYCLSDGKFCINIKTPLQLQNAISHSLNHRTHIHESLPDGSAYEIMISDSSSATHQCLLCLRPYKSSFGLEKQPSGLEKPERGTENNSFNVV